MIRIVILEDDAAQSRLLRQHLADYQQRHSGCEFQVSAFSSGAELLADGRAGAELYLMDIQMQGINGLETARLIRQRDERALIIFMTSISAYAVEAYSVEAFDYVLKPVSYAMFEAKLSRALGALEERNRETSLEIRTKTETVRLNADTVTYIEVSGHDVTVHTQNGSYTHWGSLADDEAVLPAEQFVRCNACYLVNLRYVRRVSGDAVLVDAETLAVSKAKRREFLQALAAWKGRG